MPPKKRRRPRGEGAFYQRKEDGLWIGAVLYEDEDGAKRRATVSSSDKVRAMAKFRELRARVDAGAYTPQSRMTVAGWFEYWVQEIVKPNRAPKTYKSYRGVIDHQIVPFVGEQKRLPVRPADIRSNLKWVGDHWSPRTAELTYATWSKAMGDAHREGIIASNPVDQVAKPVNNTQTGKALTSDQARQVLLSAIDVKDRMATRWAAALLLGARQGECLGLERDRVDLENLTIDLSWQLQSLDLKEGASLDDPDRLDVPAGYECRPLYRRFALTRRKGQRPSMIPLPNPLAAIFEVYMQSTKPNEYGLMWVSPAGRPIDNKTDSEAWHAALARAKVPKVRLHDARHTTATLLLEMGVEESVRMQIMGQSTVAAQRRYAHVDLSVARKALGNLDGLLEIS